MQKKNSIMKKVNIFMFIFLTVLNVTRFDIYASVDTDVWKKYDGELLGKASYVIEANSNVELYAQNADEKMYPASLVKIMTAMVVFDKVKDLEETVTFSYNAVTKDIDKNSTTIGAQAGDRLSVKDCLYSILLPSANDCANALAEYVAGNINDFVLLMNEKAQSLGMTNTHFVNPTGLHNDNQYTTAKDIGILMSYAVKNITFVQMSGSRSYRHAPIRRYRNPENSNNTVLNTNQMLSAGSKVAYYSGTLAGKTGYTKESGYNLVAYVQRNNTYLIVVDMNCKKINDRFIDAKTLLDFYFSNYKSLSIKEVDSRFDSKYENINLNGITLVDTITITISDDATILLPKEKTFDEVNSNIVFGVSNASNSIGIITYYLGNREIGKYDLIGKLTGNAENIWTAYLNFSQGQETSKLIEMNSTSKKYINKDALIYKDENGKLVISKAFILALQISIVIVIIILLIRFITSRLFFDVIDQIKIQHMKKKRNKKWR